MAWAPRYGLKGMIDASIRVKIDSNVDGPNEKIMPLEFKTGKRTSGQASLYYQPFSFKGKIDGEPVCESESMWCLFYSL